MFWQSTSRFCTRHALRGAAAFLMLLQPGPGFAWEQPHGDPTNSGFAIVQTRQATSGSVSIPNIGSFAPGAGPVVAKDGTVYIGNEQGKLMAFRADGAPYWSRDIARGQSIVASPMIDSEGNVYVIGVRTVRDHTVTPTVTRRDSTLHKFTAGGGWLYQVPFPQQGNGGAATAAPNLWRHNGAEAIMIPISYANPLTGGFETRLLAFSTGGQVLADARVGVEVPTVTGGSDYPTWQVYLCLVPPFLGCLAPAGFSLGLGGPIAQPTPTAAVFTFAGGGTPFIMAADGFENIAGFTFDAGSATLTERFRVTEDNPKVHAFTSTPMVLPDGHTLVTVPGGLRFVGPNMNQVATVKDARSFGPPTRLASGKVVVVSGPDAVILTSDGKVERRIALGSSSVASAAASSNQFFVSTADALLSFDTSTLEQVGRFDWVGGGLNPPAIGPKGHVYAIASNILFVFPPPKKIAGDAKVGQPAGTGVVQIDPAPPTAQPSSQLYHPPLTAGGNRLFACEELDEDDCGKGDHRAISLAWCQKQGYAKVKGFDVDKRKVTAETLDGRFCSKKTCRVFDSIGCEM
jgi:hypothetical protein